MFRRPFFLAAAAVLAIALTTPPDVKAWGAFHAGYTHVGYGGVQHYGTTSAYGAGRYGSVSHYGSTSAYGGARYGSVSHYGYTNVGGYSGYHYGATTAVRYNAGAYRRW